MKAINAIIIGLVAALAFSTYLLVTKFFLKADSGGPSCATVASSKQTTPAPAPSPQPPIPRHERLAMQNHPALAPPVKEEPKLRPASDIKVVMYMTDW